ncbi:MAG: hypothetical protein PHY47_06965 [Lachnospiraceae bacterium]|nr:hypothetical protein [Lachnospiraceae bacterium]
MRREDKKLLEIIRQSEINDFTKNAMEETQRKSKQVFYVSESELQVSFFEFVWQQSKYIKKKWWVCQLLILITIWAIINMMGQNDFVIRMVGISASMFAILIIPEIWKNREVGSTEIECTCIYTLRQITAARMLLFAFVDLLLLSLFGLSCIVTGIIVTEDIMVQFILPYVVTCCICFTCFYSKMSMFPAIFSCTVWCVLWTQIVLNDRVYNLISMQVWWLLLTVSFAYLVFCISKGQNRVNEFWEAKMEWN